MDTPRALIVTMVIGMAPITILYAVLLVFDGQVLIYAITKEWKGIPWEVISYSLAGGIGLFALWSLWLTLINEKKKIKRPFIIGFGLLVGAVFSGYLVFSQLQSWHWVLLLYASPFFVMMQLLYVSRKRGLWSNDHS